MPRPMLLLLAGLAAGCGGAGTPGAPPSPAPPRTCLLDDSGKRDGALVAAARGADTLLLDPARSRTPLALDCEGNARPRLASTWTHDSSRTAWTLTLSDAAGLATAWREREEASAALRYAGVTSVIPLDDHRLVVTFGMPQPTVPGVFADPALSAPLPPGRPALRRLPESGLDLRDALDHDAAVVVTADPRVLEYAATKPGWMRHALPWNRTYLLLAPQPATLLDLSPGDSVAFREALARDAVGVAARGAEPPFWWERATGCPRAPLPSTAPSEAVLYAEDDPVARALAERIVALARSPALIARGVAPQALPSAVARGAGAGYVVAVPRRALVPCREVTGWPDGGGVVPLVETHPFALLRQGGGSLAVDHDGGLVPVPRP